jgi:hypothetical protein
VRGCCTTLLPIKHTPSPIFSFCCKGTANNAATCAQAPPGASCIIQCGLILTSKISSASRRDAAAFSLRSASRYSTTSSTRKARHALSHRGNNALNSANQLSAKLCSVRHAEPTRPYLIISRLT